MIHALGQLLDVSAGERELTVQAAEEILRRGAAESATLANQLRLVQFYMRRHQVDKAIDFCDSLWKQASDHERVARLDLVQRLRINSTPTVLVLGPDGAIIKRAAGLPRKAAVIAAIGSVSEWWGRNRDSS